MEGRLAQLKTDLARRLAPVLRDVPTSLFEELVNLVASIQYERESMRYADRVEETPDRHAAGGELSTDAVRHAASREHERAGPEVPSPLDALGKRNH